MADWMTDEKGENVGPIAIVGGGIGGLTLALALEQRGLHTPVYEASARIQEVGAGIWMPPNAMQVLHRLGVAEAVVAAGMPVRRMEIRTPTGRLVRSMDLESVGERFGTDTVSIHRGRLQRILAQRLPPGRIRTGHRCLHLEETRGGTAVHFENGSTVEAGIVVGADGIHSAVRRLVCPDATVRDTGQVAIRGIAPAALPERFHGVSGEFWGTGHRFGFTAIAPDETYWWCAYDEDRWEDVFAKGAFEGARDLAAGFADPVPELVDATPPGGVIRTELEELPGLGTWHRNRAVLLGDAAHAMTPNLGQGGAQSIEDAWVLAEALAKARVSRREPDVAPWPHAPGGIEWLALEHALEEYEDRRRRRAELVATASRWTGRAAQIVHPLGRVVRNAVLRRMPRWIEERQAKRLYETPVGTETQRATVPGDPRSSSG